MILDIYSDGSATVSTRPGGFGWVLVVDGIKHSEGSGTILNATNNDAELASSVQGLIAVYRFICSTTGSDDMRMHTVTLISDSQIILGWADGSYKFKQINKIEKYNALRALIEKMNVKTMWVKGHGSNEHNNRCDYLANQARKSLEEPRLNPRKERKKKNKTLKNAALNKNIHIEEGVVLINYNGVLKRIDLTKNIVEDYTVSSEENL